MQPRVLSIVWNLIRGGTEGQCARVAMELAKRGCVHRIAVSRREGFFLDAVEQQCGPVYHMDIHRMLSLHTWKELRRLRDFIRDESFDVVHAWDADAAIFGAQAARLAGVPLITSRRDMGEIYPPKKIEKMRAADRAAAAIVVNAEAIRTKALAEGLASSNLHRIGNILDLPEFDALQNADPFGLPLPEGPKVIHVSRLDPEKDVATLIRAAAGFPEPTQVLIAGDGVERPALEALTQKLGLGDRVTFLGEVDDVPALLQQCDVGVLVPNSNEGLSNTLLEYMAAALPVVATDCGGNRELATPQTGYLIPCGDAKALAESVSKLVTDPVLAESLGTAGRSRIASEFSPEGIGDAFLALYRSVL